MFNGEEVGAVVYQNGELQLSPNRKRTKVRVYHCGDRPIQVGSHFHFFEVNKALKFERQKTFGMHLDIPSGTAIRLEPGDETIVDLVEYSGNKKLIGFNGLTMGEVDDQKVKEAAINLAHEKGYLFADDGSETE